MQELPEKQRDKLQERKAANALRVLKEHPGLVDFVSNDYLGFASTDDLYQQAEEIPADQWTRMTGSTGSRLLSGNHDLFIQAEDFVAQFHGCESALIFNSGYDANLGLFSCVPLRGDLILFDEYVHASIRDGIRMSQAKSYKFNHNDLKHLLELIHRHKNQISENGGKIYVATESVFSMDGDSPDLSAIAKLCRDQSCLLIVDEAHAVGIWGQNGGGLVEESNLGKSVFARVVTFGKALGVHGAAVLGSSGLKEYLINFARSFIYTTAMPPHAVGLVMLAYRRLKSKNGATARKELKENIDYFVDLLGSYRLRDYFIHSNSAIQSCIIPGNKEVKRISGTLMQKGYDVRPILSPTVPESEERLRFSIHSFNTKSEINDVLMILSKYLNPK